MAVAGAQLMRTFAANLHLTTVLLICLALSACGTTGGTSRFALALELEPEPPITTGIRIASAAMEPDAAHLVIVNVKPWGKFTPADLANLEQSLQNTLAPHLPAQALASGQVLDLHLVIRRHVVAGSNTAGAVLACVAWAATTSDGEVLYQEQFYAAKAGYLLTTIGLLKDSVHRAIVRRIAVIALALAADPEHAGPLSAPLAGTSTSFNVAVSRLPQKLVSLGDPALMAMPSLEFGFLGLITPSGATRVQWELAEPPADFDWQSYLAEQRAGP